MTPSQDRAGTQDRDDQGDRNEVTLVGRVSGDPESRELPSGDTIWVFRVVVRRPAGSRGRSSVDTLDCVAWSGQARRTVQRWRSGDAVEVNGSVRRRFFRAGGATVSRVEVEVRGGRLRRRAAVA